MSFIRYKKIIEEGDTNRNTIDHIRVTKGQKFSAKFGHFRHDDLIGKRFGLKFTSHQGKGFVYLLHPTPELWTMALPHRTQILYSADIAFISSYLDLKPGYKVIESGTGSGSFSHAISRTIGDEGHLHTFEYHLERSQLARKEFDEHKLTNVTVNHRDVCKEGFGLVNAVDAVFLDLPAPWEAIPSAKIALKKENETRICSFSPCIEQVQRACLALSDNGFKDIRTYECIIRGYDMAYVSNSTWSEITSQLIARSKKRKTSKETDSNDSNEDLKEEKNIEEIEDDKTAPKRKAHISETGKIVLKSAYQMRGHTSYLTFALLPPALPTNTKE